MVPIMIGLLLTGEGYVWYFQKRVGFKNQNFDIWKFATMLKNSPSMGTGSLTLRDDPRVTSMGKYLRKSKVNELPQLINVLIGNMSLVGPRPQMQVDFDVYSEAVKASIYDAKPGITGIGSIVFRDEEKWISESKLGAKVFYAREIAPYKGALELWYLNNRSTIVDIKLLFLTFWVIIKPEGNTVFNWIKGLPDPPAYMTELSSK